MGHDQRLAVLALVRLRLAGFERRLVEHGVGLQLVRERFIVGNVVERFLERFFRFIERFVDVGVIVERVIQQWVGIIQWRWLVERLRVVWFGQQRSEQRHVERGQ